MKKVSISYCRCVIVAWSNIIGKLQTVHNAQETYYSCRYGTFRSGQERIIYDSVDYIYNIIGGLVDTQSFLCTLHEVFDFSECMG